MSSSKQNLFLTKTILKLDDMGNSKESETSQNQTPRKNKLRNSNFQMTKIKVIPYTKSNYERNSHPKNQPKSKPIVLIQKNSNSSFSKDTSLEAMYTTTPYQAHHIFPITQEKEIPYTKESSIQNKNNSENTVMESSITGDIPTDLRVNNLPSNFTTKNHMNKTEVMHLNYSNDDIQETLVNTKERQIHDFFQDFSYNVPNALQTHFKISKNSDNQDEFFRNRNNNNIDNISPISSTRKRKNELFQESNKKQCLRKGLSNEIWEKISSFVFEKNSFFKNPLFRCNNELRLFLLQKLDVNMLSKKELKIILDHFSYIDKDQNLRTTINFGNDKISNLNSLDENLILQSANSSNYEESIEHSNISNIPNFQEQFGVPPNFPGRLRFDQIPRFVEIYNNTLDPFFNINGSRGSKNQIGDKFKTILVVPNNLPVVTNVKLNIESNSLFRFSQSESSLRNWIQLCLDEIEVTHAKEYLIMLTRPVGYIEKKQNLAQTIEQRLCDIIHFWNILEKNRSSLRQRYLFELVILTTVFYLIQVYKKRMLKNCSQNYFEDMRTANIDSFIRFQLVDWHSRDLIVGENISFYVFHPRNSEYIISVAKSLYNLNNNNLLSIFPNPMIALSTTKIDNFFLRCLLTFSICTQESGFVDLPLLKPLFHLQTFEDQDQILKKEDKLIVLDGEKIRKISPHYSNLKDTFTFQELLQLRFSEDVNISFPPTQKISMRMEQDAACSLCENKIKTLEQKNKSSKSQDTCCIQGCYEKCTSDNPTYDSLNGIWLLKQENIEDMSRERLICKFHYLSDKQSQNNSKNPSISNISPTTGKKTISSALCSLAIANAKRKFPNLNKEIDSKLSKIPKKISDDNRIEYILSIILDMEDEALKETNNEWNSHKSILERYILNIHPHLSTEITLLSTSSNFTTEQKIELLSDIIMLFPSKISNYNLLKLLFEEASKLYPEHLNLMNAIANTSELSSLAEKEEFRYFILLNFIRLKQKPLGVGKSPILHRILDYDIIDSILNNMISVYLRCECKSQSIS